MGINLSWHDLLFLKPWNISWAMRILSEINLLCTKADWVSEISEGRQAFNLWHKIFYIILYPTLHKLISLSSVILVGLSILGIKQMLVIFNLVSSFPVTKKILNISSKSFFIVCQECWKNRAVNPSDPRAFYGCIINMTCLIWSSVAVLINRWFIWGDGKYNIVQKNLRIPRERLS